MCQRVQSLRTQVLLAVLFLAGFGASHGLADFMAVPPVRDNRFGYSFVATWDFADGNEPLTEVTPPGAPWAVAFSSGPSVNGMKDLLQGVVHVTPPHAGEGPNILPIIQFDGVLLRPMQAGSTNRYAMAIQQTHPGRVPPLPGGRVDRDIVRTLVQVPANPNQPAIITTTGEHTSGTLATGSVLGIRGEVKIFAQFEDGTEALVSTDANGQPGKRQVQPRDHYVVPLIDPNDPNKNDPVLRKKAVGYRVVAAVNGANLQDPLSTTELAFLGEVDGAPGELELGPAFELFNGLDEAFLPLLIDPLGGDLFVGIDLTQFLGLMPSFHVGDMFNFVSGHSDQLPGVVVGSSPVTFDPMTGQFTTASPASGNFEVSGFIDGGEAVPEPASLTLLGLGAAGLLGYGWKRKRVA